MARRPFLSDHWRMKWLTCLEGTHFNRFPLDFNWFATQIRSTDQTKVGCTQIRKRFKIASQNLQRNNDALSPQLGEQTND